jgi:hypothetical protein
MEVPWLLVVHGLVTALVVVSFLCGQWPIFEGTFIQSINHFLTFGAYHYLLYVLASPSSSSLLSCAPAYRVEGLFAQAVRSGGVRQRGQGSRPRRRAVLLRPAQPDPAGT